MSPEEELKKIKEDILRIRSAILVASKNIRICQSTTDMSLTEYRRLQNEAIGELMYALRDTDNYDD